jgi:hypothetical protein
MRDFTQRELQGAATAEESCDDRNKRMGWGCKCHGMTFCPDLTCVGYDDGVPVFVTHAEAARLRDRNAK